MNRILVGVRNFLFSKSVQPGPGVHPASYTLGIEPFFGVKRPGGGVDHTLAYSAAVKERVEL
jgi:hypothetical protein